MTRISNQRVYITGGSSGLKRLMPAPVYWGLPDLIVKKMGRRP